MRGRTSLRWERCSTRWCRGGGRSMEKSPASVIAAILERNPPALSTLQTLTPPALDHIVARCLAKDPDERWQSAGDVMRELKWVAGTAAASASATVSRSRLREYLWMVAAAAWPPRSVPWRSCARPPSPEPRPDGDVAGSAAEVSRGGLMQFSISPDGRHLVFVARGAGRSRVSGSARSPQTQTRDRSKEPSVERSFLVCRQSQHRVLRPRPTEACSSGRRHGADGLHSRGAAALGEGAGGTWNRDDVILFADVGMVSSASRLLGGSLCS